MKIGDELTAQLHTRHLKPRGFKKKGRTFSCAHAAYSEHYNIQGSAWNSSDEPWRFYVNVGINFTDIPLRDAAGMWKYHAHTRLPFLVRSAPAEYDLTPVNFEQLLEQLADEFLKCSEYFSRRHAILKESYLKSLYIRNGLFLYDSELKEPSR